MPSFAPVWWGWGWGFGYYPLYPRPTYDHYGPDQVSRITTRLFVNGSGTLRHGGYSAGLALGLEGERLGFHFGIDGFYPGRNYYSPTVIGFDSSSTFAFATAHLTAALLSTDVARVRVEIGGSLLSWPDAGPDAGSVSFGPDAGVSGQLGLVGPLGIEAYGRVTPFPTLLYDWQAALAFRMGPAALTAGWRELSVHRTSGANLTSFAFAGPQVALGLRF